MNPLNVVGIVHKRDRQTTTDHTTAKCVETGRFHTKSLKVVYSS